MELEKQLKDARIEVEKITNNKRELEEKEICNLKTIDVLRVLKIHVLNLLSW